MKQDELERCEDFQIPLKSQNKNYNEHKFAIQTTLIWVIIAIYLLDSFNEK